MEKITSKTNNLIKHAAKLSASGSARKKCGQFILEGVRLCCDVLNSDIRLLTVFVTEACLERYRDDIMSLLEKSEKSYLISDEIAGKLADTVHPQGLFSICEAGINQMDLQADGKYIILDQIQDPSNLGAIIRTAEALGLNGAIVSGGADLYNPKALRASMGSLLRMPVRLAAHLPQVLLELKAVGIPVFAAVPDRGAKRITAVPMQGCVAAVIGNEANGVSRPVLEIADQIVTIPMGGRAESLNAATAASIVMWEMTRGSLL